MESHQKNQWGKDAREMIIIIHIYSHYIKINKIVIQSSKTNKTYFKIMFLISPISPANPDVMNIME